MFTSKEIDAWIKNTKFAIPLLEERINKLSLLLPTDEQIEQIYKQRNDISNMLKTLKEISKQLIVIKV